MPLASKSRLSSMPPSPNTTPLAQCPQDPTPKDVSGTAIWNLLQSVGSRQVNYNLSTTASLNLLTPTRPRLPVNEQVLDALNNIATTPYENSFLSRLQGRSPARTPIPIAIDWETISPWVRLMEDVRHHYTFSRVRTDSRTVGEKIAPIVYTTLQASHLPQIHDLLERVFWSGIDVSDSLDYLPEQATVVATYKSLVIGAGWDKTQIAKTMVYHLITRNPNKDITLHVSANNSAMLLYNQFGFKAEEFVAGFYDDYLDPLSRASKNAFKLRLRQ